MRALPYGPVFSVPVCLDARTAPGRRQVSRAPLAIGMPVPVGIQRVPAVAGLELATGPAMVEHREARPVEGVVTRSAHAG
jgi:hypothetical protein